MKDLAKPLRPHFLLPQAGVLQQCLICVEMISVNTNRDDELRYCIDDCSKLGFGFGDLVEGCRESSSGSLAFDRDQCKVPCGFDELNFGVIRYPRLGGVEGKGTKHLAILRQNRLGPRCANPVPDGKVLKLIGPVCVRCNVRDDDVLFQERGGAAAS